MADRRIFVDDEFSDDPNARDIASFLRAEYPEILNKEQETVMESVVAEMIGTRQIRLGSRPTPESEVAMRDVARRCIEVGHPIPVLVVAGPKKPLRDESIDLAELSALKMLACLNARVMAYYPPGITVNIRLEDATGYYLEEGTDGLHRSIENYIRDLSTLIKILGYDFIKPVREQTLVKPETLRQAAETLRPLFVSYLTDSDQLPEDQWENLGSLKELSKVGWKGLITRNTRRYYLERYQRLVPGYDEKQGILMMAKYFAVTLARYQLKATGVENSWPGFFQINFAPPIPDTPKSLTSTRIYYRTVPLKHTDRHMPFWRAKGYLRLNGETKISLASWNEPFEYKKLAITFTDGMDSVRVQSDYLEV